VTGFGRLHLDLVAFGIVHHECADPKFGAVARRGLSQII